MQYANVTSLGGLFKLEKERRKFFDNFAKSKQFDPLDVEKWYGVTQTDIRKAVSCDFIIFSQN